jgi:hypothetical protein
MARSKISINQLPEFSYGSKADKRRILKQQIVPSTFRIQWYQLAKSRIRKYFQNVNDLTPIIKGITILNGRTPTKPNKITDKRISLEALEKIKEIKIPKLLKTGHYATIKPPVKSMIFNDVEIIVAPDVIFRLERGGEVLYGALKIHIVKDAFDYKQAQCISALLYKYLKEEVVKKGEKISLDLCLCLDIFSDRLAPANDPEEVLKELAKICTEVKDVWAEVERSLE